MVILFILLSTSVRVYNLNTRQQSVLYLYHSSCDADCTRSRTIGSPDMQRSTYLYVQGLVLGSTHVCTLTLRRGANVRHLAIPGTSPLGCCYQMLLNWHWSCSLTRCLHCICMNMKSAMTCSPCRCSPWTNCLEYL